MNHVIEHYDGHDEESEGFYQSPGAIHSFSSAGKTYRFNIETDTPKLAIVEKSQIFGVSASVMMNEPYGNNPAVIKIPLECTVFIEALEILKLLGVSELAVFNQKIGHYSHIPIP